MHPDVSRVGQGSYKRIGGYTAGIRGKTHVILSMEAALWASWSTETFKEGVLAAVNLGDDSNTTAAIYGQLAGAFYRFGGIPSHWSEQIYAGVFFWKISEWITYEGEQYQERTQPSHASKKTPIPVKSTSNTILSAKLLSEDHPPPIRDKEGKFNRTPAYKELTFDYSF